MVVVVVVVIKVWLWLLMKTVVVDLPPYEELFSDKAEKQKERRLKLLDAKLGMTARKKERERGNGAVYLKFIGGDHGPIGFNDVMMRL